MREEFHALPEPVFHPRPAVALLPKLAEPGPIKLRLAQPANDEEMRIAIQTKGGSVTCKPIATELLKPAAPPAPPKPRHQPGDLLFVQYVKCKLDYVLEYRKREDGSRYLYHAETHLMEQLSQLPVEEHKAAMKRMHYTYVKWFQNS